MNKITKIIVLFIVLAFAGAAVWYATRSTSPKVTGNYDDFAKCLRDKNITMYGAYYCSHCQDQKAAFGSSFQYVPYVECTQDTQKCLEKKVNFYPTWIFPDGKSLVGFQELSQLAQESGCALPAVQ